MEIDDVSAKEEGERAVSAARNLATSTVDVWLVRCAVLVIVALQFLVVNDLTLLPRWVMPSLGTGSSIAFVDRHRVVYWRDKEGRSC